MGQSSPRGRGFFPFAVFFLLAEPLSALTITELHPQPPEGGPNLQFVEVYNEASSVVDLSGWSFARGLLYVFPEGTFLAGRSYLVIAADAAAIRSRYGIQNVLGDFLGALDPRGETLEIVSDSGVLEVEVSYKDRGKWPSGHKGTGHTLSLRDPYLDPDDGVHWTWSLEPGGTPGRLNFPPRVATTEETEVIARGATWKYKEGTEEFSSLPAAWREAGFDDDAWFSGPTGIGYDDYDEYDVATPLNDMRYHFISFAARKEFSLDAAQIEAAETVVLAIDYDDGFIAYLNGREFARSGLGDSGEEVAIDRTADDHEAVGEEEFPVPEGYLAAGRNVLAVEVHNTAIDSSDAIFLPRFLLRRQLRPEAGSSVVLNELFARTGGERWFELLNSSGAELDLSGFHLSDDSTLPSKFTVPDLTVVPKDGFLAFSEAQTGLDFASAEVFLFVSPPDTTRIADARLFEVAGPSVRDGTSDARFPDGSPNWVFDKSPTRAAANRLEVERDIVINEILYHPFESRPAAGQPLDVRPGEFIELYNRGQRPVQLAGFAFTKGVNFDFPSDAQIGPGEYLVVAQNPHFIASTYGLAGVLGPWKGSLQNDGETIRLEDPLGNAVNEVTYFEGGEWSELADGGGSSLELIDPRQDSSAGSAWAASDETAKASWTQLSYTGSYAMLGESLFHLTPMDSGSFLLDDVEILKGAVNYVSNPGFESGTEPWVMQGTLVHSRRTTAEAHSGSASLEVVATDRGDIRVNRLAVLTQPPLTEGSYTVQFWARWLRGGNLILVHGFDNDMARTLWLPVPRNLGTPGAENSATRALRMATGSVNLGPIIHGAEQVPVRPDQGQSVAVSASISDADGIASARVLYRLGGRGDGVFTPVVMAPAPGPPGGGRFGAALPGFDRGMKVLYYFEAVDATGRSRRLPVEAPARTFLYQVGPVEGGPLSRYRLILDDDAQEELQSRSIQADDPLYGSFVFDDEEIYHEVAVHYHGSPWERPGTPRSFKIAFPGDRPLHGVKKFNISRYGSALNESAAYYTVGRSGRIDAPSPHGEYQFVRWDVSGEDQGILGRVETVDGSYLKRWFPGQDNGSLFRANAKISYNLDGSWSVTRWAALEYLGPDKESYRWNWDLHTREMEDEWSPLIELMRAMDASTTSGEEEFEARVKEVLDVDEFLRILAVRVLNNDWDMMGLVYGQNLYLYHAPLEGRWKYIPWDMDGTFVGVDQTFFPGGDPGISRILARPFFQRRYLQWMGRILATTWSESRLRPFLDPNTAAGVQNGGGIIGFVNARRPLALAFLDRGGTFRILTNSGNDLVLAADSVAIQGKAPLGIEGIYLDGAPPPQLAWSDVLHWSAVVPLIPGENHLDFLGFDAEGSLAGRASIRVTSTLVWNPPVVGSVTPDIGPGAGGTRVSIRGGDFHAGVMVDFGGTAAEAVTFLSGSEIEAVSPPGSGVVTVKATNPDGQWGSLPSAFTFLAGAFIRGDANRDGVVDLSDALKILFFLFAGDALDCQDAADVDDGGTLDLTDPIFLLEYLFLGGPPPPPPFPLLGTVPPGDGLGCLR